MLEDLKEAVCAANLDLMTQGAVIYTWGNVSSISDDRKYMVIKPSSVDYDGMRQEDMVVVDIASGERVEGKWNPSSDTKTHLELYRKYSSIKGIVHTLSVNAVVFAQAGMKIPALGTTFLWGYSLYKRTYATRSNGGLRNQYRKGDYRSHREWEI